MFFVGAILFILSIASNEVNGDASFDGQQEASFSSNRRLVGSDFIQAPRGIKEIRNTFFNRTFGNGEILRSIIKKQKLDLPLESPFNLRGRRSLPSAECGDVISEDTRLQKNLDCDCGEGPALTLLGPAFLDLNGFTVSCSQNPFNPCIFIDEDSPTIFSSSLKRGTLQNCAPGIFGISTVFNARISRVTIKDSDGGIILPFSNGNRVSDVTIKDIQFQGILFLGDNNFARRVKVRRVNQLECLLAAGSNNTVLDSDFKGSANWDCLGASPLDDLTPPFIFNNVFKNNKVENCGESGISFFSGGNSIVSDNQISRTNESSILAGFNGTEISGNVVKNSKSNGIITFGTDYKILNNRIENVNDDAIDLATRTTGNSNIVRDNHILNCKDRGIDAPGDGNQITNNVIVNCKLGIVLDEGASGNTLENNQVGSSDILDFVDFNENCGTNTWRRNIGSGNQTCTGALF